MKKVIVVLLILTMVISSSSAVFAGESVNSQQLIAEKQADNIEAVTGIDDVTACVGRTRTDFVVNGVNLEVEIPKAGDDEIGFESTTGEPFTMGLPNEVEDARGVLTEHGTVIYDGDEDVSVAVQSTCQFQDGLIIEGVRSMILIHDASAPSEYAFDYDLPRGYQLVSSEDYYETEEVEAGWIYIVDKNNLFVDNNTEEEFMEIVAAIEPAWAKDADGNNIPTYYRIEGDSLIQVVNFDEESSFPITADPTTTTKPKNTLLASGTDVVKINNSDVSAIVTLAGFGTQVAKAGFKKAFQKYALQELKEALEKQLVKKGIKYVSGLISVATAAIDIYCAYQWLVKGYTYTHIKYKYEEWKIYKHQGGRWVAGYSHKFIPIEVWGS